jgi:hypothetical protein
VFVLVVGTPVPDVWIVGAVAELACAHAGEWVVGIADEELTVAAGNAVLLLALHGNLCAYAIKFRAPLGKLLIMVA